MSKPKSHRQDSSSGCYLYGIVRTPVAPECCGITGLLDSPLSTVETEDLAVIVSEAPKGRIRPERRNIAAHHRVQQHLMSLGPLLPMAFGMVADSRKGAERMLGTYRKDFLHQLERVSGKVEMGLRVSLETPQVVDYFVARSPELQALRDQLAVHGGGSRDDRIELGRQFEQLLQQIRDELVEQIETVLAPVCADFQRNPERSERDLANLACLVRRDQLDTFEARIGEAAKHFDDEHVFQFSGPWPPHNFIKLDVRI